MSDERRASYRIPVPLAVTLTWPEHGEYACETVDVSDTGVLLKGDDATPRPPVGTRVTICLSNPLGNGDAPPVLSAEVVRSDASGVALAFKL